MSNGWSEPASTRSAPANSTSVAQHGRVVRDRVVVEAPQRVLGRASRAGRREVRPARGAAARAARAPRRRRGRAAPAGPVALEHAGEHHVRRRDRRLQRVADRVPQVVVVEPGPSKPRVVGWTNTSAPVSSAAAQNGAKRSSPRARRYARRDLDAGEARAMTLEVAPPRARVLERHRAEHAHAIATRSASSRPGVLDAAALERLVGSASSRAGSPTGTARRGRSRPRPARRGSASTSTNSPDRRADAPAAELDDLRAVLPPDARAPRLDGARRAGPRGRSRGRGRRSSCGRDQQQRPGDDERRADPHARASRARRGGRPAAARGAGRPGPTRAPARARPRPSCRRSPPSATTSTARRARRRAP